MHVFHKRKYTLLYTTTLHVSTYIIHAYFCSCFYLNSFTLHVRLYFYTFYIYYAISMFTYKLNSCISYTLFIILTQHYCFSFYAKEYTYDIYNCHVIMHRCGSYVPPNFIALALLLKGWTEVFDLSQNGYLISWFWIWQSK